MDTEKITLLKQKIEEDELVLIGIGEEWELKQQDFEENPDFSEAMQKYGEDSLLLPYMKKMMLEEAASPKMEQRKKYYSQLADLVKDKNYFVVSLCNDGYLSESGLREDRIVEPCGTYRKLQCAEGCSTELYDVAPEWMEEIKSGLFQKETVKTENAPICPKCGKPLVFNTVLAENYVEEGYLEQWGIYTKWLQGTVNRKVCILEIGVGMRFPTVIRWPFEKIAFFNQKASFFRVHSKLYQTTEEIKEKSYGIKASLDEFFGELSRED